MLSTIPNELVRGSVTPKMEMEISLITHDFNELSTAAKEMSEMILQRSVDQIDHIDMEGLNDYYRILSRYRSDDSYSFEVEKRKLEENENDSALGVLKADLDKQDRALRRLQDLYLYSDNAISEKDFTVRKMEIADQIRDLQRQISTLGASSDLTISDEDFVRQASHLLIQKELKGRDYIYFQKLSENVSAEILKAYMESVLKSVHISDRKIIQIVFKNELTHKFIYKE